VLAKNESFSAAKMVRGVLPAVPQVQNLPKTSKTVQGAQEEMSKAPNLLNI